MTSDSQSHPRMPSRLKRRPRNRPCNPERHRRRSEPHGYSQKEENRTERRPVLNARDLAVALRIKTTRRGGIFPVDTHERGSGSKPRKIRTGEGWISGSRLVGCLVTQVRVEPLRVEPRAWGAVVGRVLHTQVSVLPKAKKRRSR